MTNTNLKQAFQNFRENFVQNDIYDGLCFANNDKFEKECIKLLNDYGINSDEYEVKEIDSKRCIINGIKNGHKVLITVTNKYRNYGYYDFIYQIRFKVDGKSMKNAEFAKWYNE